MELKVIAVFDAKLDAFMIPAFMQTRGMAMRGFIDACKKEGHEFAKHPEDYTLFELGVYDQESGKFQNHKAPESLGAAIHLIEAVGGG